MISSHHFQGHPLIERSHANCDIVKKLHEYPAHAKEDNRPELRVLFCSEDGLAAVDHTLDEILVRLHLSEGTLKRRQHRAHRA